STGTMQAPPSRAAAISNSPASTSDSLLANSRRLPARAAARVESSPAAPTMAATTVWQASQAARSVIASMPAWACVGSFAAARPSRSAACSAGSAIAAWSGRWRRHRPSSASTLLPAASTDARRRSGWRAITSSAEEPIEPVAPRTATDCMAVEECTSGTGMSETEQFLAEQEHRQGGEHAVEAVEDATVSRDHVARVLGPDVALEQALEQVADHREQHRRERHQRQRRQLRGRGAGQPAEGQPGGDAGHEATQEALDRLVGADPRRQLAALEQPAAEMAPGEVGARIGGPDDRQR